MGVLLVDGGRGHRYLGSLDIPYYGECVTVYGTKICDLDVADNTVMTITPGTSTNLSANPPTSASNAGPAISFTFRASDTALIDTGMLGPSDCDVRPSTERGDPINISSGNVFRNAVDAVINSGKIGAFSFERNYNSLNQEISSFGYGWQHNYDIKIMGSSTLQKGSGQRITYYPTFGVDFIQHYSPPPGITDSLFLDSDIFVYWLKTRNGDSVDFNHISTNPYKSISSVTDRNGNQTKFIYTSSKLDTIKEPGGRFYKLKYTGKRIDTLKNQAGTVLATYSYYTGADTNYLKKVTYGDGSWEEYSYEASGSPKKLIKVLTSDSNEHFYEYGSKGQAKATYRTGNVERIDVTYERGVTTGSNGDSLVAVVTDSLGNRDTLVTYPNALATDRLLTRGRNASSCGSCAERYAYDNHSNVIRRISQLNVVDSMSYDVRDRLIFRVEAKRIDGTASFARTHAFRYVNFDLVSRDSTGSVVNTSDTLVRRFFYDATGNDTMTIETGLIAIGNRYADTSRFSYNSSGQITKIDGPRTDVGDTSRFFYNSTTGDLDSVREFVGSTVLTTKYASYDAFGNPLTVIGPNSDTTIYQYDERQRVKNVKRRKGSSVDSTLYQYNFAGNIKKIILPLGGADSIKYVYDLTGQLTYIINGAADTTVYTYDLMSNRKSETLRKGAVRRTTYFHYDTRSRLVTIRTGDTTSAALFDSTGFRYDDVGNRIMQISGRGDTTFYRYDALNRLDMVRQKHDGIVDTTLYTYDLQDNLTKVISPSHDTTTYKYSDRGHLIEENSPASGITAYTYDPTGNLIRKIPATGNADSVTYTYDALNRQTQIKFGSQNFTFDYDASATNNRKGRLWRETGPSATRKFSYDYAGRVTAESLIVSSVTYLVLYSWDKNGNLTKLTYPSLREINYTYDAADRITKVTAKKGAITTTVFDSAFYLPFGPDTSMKLGNGIKVRKVFDKRYFADSIKNTTAGIFGRRYRYDHNGNIIGLVDLIDNTKSYDTLTYDGVDRLLAAKGNNRADSLRFTYAKNGNRLTKKKTTSTTTYNYTNNRLRNTTGVEVVNYGYNANGSVTGDTLSGSTITYTYDKLNRITKITGISPADSFAYDGENKRVYRDDEGFIRHFIYDIYGNPIEESNEGIWTIDYLWANGEPRARIDNPVDGGVGLLVVGEEYLWYHNDHLGTPHVLTDKNKGVVWKISLDPFGETVSETGSGPTDNLRFPGQYLDRGSNLNYNWFRYYQPKIGRYYQVDPVPGQTTINLYAYTNSNPVVLIDRTGQFAEGSTIVCLIRVRRKATDRSITTLDIDEKPTFQDGKRDAFRHCFGLCLGIRTCGASPAMAAGAVKEFFDPFIESGSEKEKDRRKRMDTYNNKQGAECAGKKNCPSCYSCCFSKLNNGLLDVWKKESAK